MREPCRDVGGRRFGAVALPFVKDINKLSAMLSESPLGPGLSDRTGVPGGAGGAEKTLAGVGTEPGLGVTTSSESSELLPLACHSTKLGCLPSLPVSLPSGVLKPHSDCNLFMTWPSLRVVAGELGIGTESEPEKMRSSF